MKITREDLISIFEELEGKDIPELIININLECYSREITGSKSFYRELYVKYRTLQALEYIVNSFSKKELTDEKLLIKVNNCIQDIDETIYKTEEDDIIEQKEREFQESITPSKEWMKKYEEVKKAYENGENIFLRGSQNYNFVRTQRRHFEKKSLKSNSIKLLNQLDRQILMPIKKKRSFDENIKEFNQFCFINNKKPSRKSKNKNERRLADWFRGIKRNKNIDESKKTKIDDILKKYP